MKAPGHRLVCEHSKDLFAFANENDLNILSGHAYPGMVDTIDLLQIC